MRTRPVLRLRLYSHVSIHATHAGGDKAGVESAHPERVSIHATHAGGDQALPHPFGADELFQSPPPTRAATTFHPAGSAFPSRFNPRHPRGRRRYALGPPSPTGRVSIHATHAGGDSHQATSPPAEISFNPRHPRGRR